MLVEDEKFMVSGQWGPSCSVSQCRKEPGHGWKGGLKLDMQAVRAQEGFRQGSHSPGQDLLLHGEFCMQREGFSTAGSAYRENPCFPLCSSVAKATVFTGITCFRALLGPQTSFTQGFTHRLLCSIFYSSKWQNLYYTAQKLLSDMVGTSITAGLFSCPEKHLLH